MQLSCNVTKVDLLAFNFNLMKQSVFWKVFFLAFFVYFTYAGMQIAINLEGSSSLPRTIFVGVAIGLKYYSIVILGTAIGMVVSIFIMPQRGKNKSIFCRHEYEVNEEGLIEKTDMNETPTKFPGIEKVVSTKKHVFIFVGTKQAFVIPKQRIVDGDITAFEQALRSKLA